MDVLEANSGNHGLWPTIEKMTYIPDSLEEDIKTLILSPGGSGADSLGTDYFIYDRMFSETFLLGLTDEMKWLEEHYKNDFIDSKVHRSSGTTQEDNYATYHRVSKVYWLTFVKEHDMQYLPNLKKFKDWIVLLRASINKELHETGEEFEVASIEEQYIYYSQGGKFEAHLDTQCNAIRNCPVGKEHHYPRLLTYIIYLNPGWQKRDGGEYKTYYNWP